MVEESANFLVGEQRSVLLPKKHKCISAPYRGSVLKAAMCLCVRDGKVCGTVSSQT